MEQATIKRGAGTPRATFSSPSAAVRLRAHAEAVAACLTAGRVGYSRSTLIGYRAALCAAATVTAAMAAAVAAVTRVR